MKKPNLSPAIFILSLTCVAYSAPTLVPGVWKNITPSALTLSGTFGTPGIAIDPSNPYTLYLSADTKGLWKTTDGGSNWVRLGTPPAQPDYGTSVGYLDSPVQIGVDPNNSNHLWGTQGVRGYALGFWESTDGGTTWKQPTGFIAISSTIGTRDMTMLEVDKGDFNHVLLGSHSNWNGASSGGILETRDGGATFVAHPPVAGFTAGSMGVHILRCPSLGIGNDSTWLVQTDGNGFFRTTNRGRNWTKVSDYNSPHAPPQIYYAKNGTIYSGASSYPVRSTDNGITWQQISSGISYFYYSGIVGDGNYVYTAQSYASNGGSYNCPYFTFPEVNGTKWSEYNPLGTGSQKFDNGPGTMVFDTVHRIVYGAQWTAGLWALKVLDPATVVENRATAKVSNNMTVKMNMAIALSAGRIIVSNGKQLYDVTGRRQLRVR